MGLLEVSPQGDLSARVTELMQCLYETDEEDDVGEKGGSNVDTLTEIRVPRNHDERRYLGKIESPLSGTSTYHICAYAFVTLARLQARPIYAKPSSCTKNPCVSIACVGSSGRRTCCSRCSATPMTNRSTSKILLLPDSTCGTLLMCRRARMFQFNAVLRLSCPILLQAHIDPPRSRLSPL